MNKTLMKIVPNQVIAKVSRQILVTKKNSPTIFFVAGVAGVITSTVLACRATIKLSSTLDEVKKDIEQVRPLPDVEVMPDGIEGHAIETHVQHVDVLYAYGRAGMRIFRLYAPAAVLGVASIGALTGSHVALQRRNSALMAAYAGVQEAYAAYRERVREELGAEKEQELYIGARKELMTVDGEPRDVRIVDPSKFSPYARFFDEGSKNWQKNSEYNNIFLNVTQKWMNELLHTRGHLFLNEVYDAIDVPRTSAGAMVGWVMNGDGDGFVDFGMFDAYSSRFINGDERSILLDFNVDGVIYDKI